MSKKCPAHNALELNNIESCYAIYSNDREDYYTSSSAGLATCLNKTFLEKNGWIVGSCYNDNLVVYSKLTKDFADIERFRGSKYVHNYVEKSVYLDIFDRLKSGQFVLFIGLPCQCAAVKRFCALHEENLYLVDLLCHGGTSPRLFEEHVKFIQSFKGKVDNITFRGGEHDFSFCAWRNGKLVYSSSMQQDEFFHVFVSHSAFRESCYQCQYSSCKRIGDLTIGDFWGLEEDFKINHNLTHGVNVCLVNSDKGVRLLKLLENKVTCIARPLEEAIENNDTLREPTRKPANFETLTKLFSNIGLYNTVHRYDEKYNTVIRNRKDKTLLWRFYSIWAPKSLVVVINRLRTKK